MSARKLQAEIERTLKKVKEGVEEFEALHDKLQGSQNQAQKEKMESDLKTMIKKLQRLRDQIKTWLQSHEIKDKTALLENRRLIETQMERFKAVEKEMKTKAFSKEGLAAARLDPAERAKLDATNWLSNHVDELSHQVEAAEAEIEQLGANTKKSRKANNSKEERIATLQSQNETRQWHISRLELLLRVVENGSLEPEEIDDIKDEVDYFVEKNGEEDMDEYEYIYDQFNLDEEEAKFGLKETDDLTSSHESVSGMEDAPKPKPKREPSEESREPPPAKDKETVKEKKKKKDSKERETKDAPRPLKDEGTDKTVVPPANFTKQPPPAPTLVSPPKLATPHLPPIRYATAAAAAMGHTNADDSFDTAGPVQVKSPLLERPAPEASPAASHTGALPPPPGLSAQVDSLTESLAKASVESTTSRDLPPALGGVADTLEQAKQTSLLGTPAASNDVARALESSTASAPNALDSEKPKYYVPKMAYPTPAYYPQVPLPIFDSAGLYAKLDVDTLFFIFYYQQGTYHQYLAARELKRQSWRFHKQYLTWFQRHTEPTEITDEYEVGTYIYFDWEGSWLQRKKNDFRFEYRWLED